ncbi:AAA family ATPase [Rhodovulum sulfidophilum]|nr:AAA family ATPase [Rhodovulum sulfidophilum]
MGQGSNNRAGSRFGGDQHGMSCRTQVVNGFLQQIDRLTRTLGVILIGDCNQISRLDPAITRPGRIDQIERMPPPSIADIRRILGKVLADNLTRSFMNSSKPRACRRMWSPFGCGACQSVSQEPDTDSCR